MGTDDEHLKDLADALNATVEIDDLVEQMLEVAAIVEDADLGGDDYCGVLVVTPLDLAEPR
jgi:hypothetical protein